MLKLRLEIIFCILPRQCPDFLVAIPTDLYDPTLTSKLAYFVVHVADLIPGFLEDGFRSGLANSSNAAITLPMALVGC